MSRKIRLLLIVSLLLNIAFIGVAMGQYIKQIQWHGNEKRHLAEVIRLLPQDKQVEFSEKMAAAKEQQAQLFAQMRRIRQESMDILTAETFDMAAYQAKVAELQALRAQMKDGMAQLVQEFAGQMDQSQREQLARTLRYNRPWEPRVDTTKAEKK